MPKKSDIINQFMQSKKRKKYRRTGSKSSFNRLLGSQVLKTNKVVKISKLKQTNFESLSKLTTTHGFNKIMKEARYDQSTLEKTLSGVFHNHITEIIDWLLNEVILNTKIIYKTLLIFLGLNTFLYSIHVVYNYHYQAIIVGGLLAISAIISLFIELVSKLIRKQ